MTITFVGHGYVGLVTAAVFADLGNIVWVIGHTPKKIENLKKGIIPIYEPGLEEIVKRNIKAKRLFFTLKYGEAIPQADVVFIAVGTPSKDDGEADLSAVFEVAKKIGQHLDGYTVIATKSTVPIGTNRRIKVIVDEVKPKKATFDVASVPEFLREGQAIADTLNPDRIVIGTGSERARKVIADLHKPIDGHIVLTSTGAAEMIKYAANAFLSTKISFANAIAKLCELSGVDIQEVLEGVGYDKRIGREFLNPGVGFGGSCFPKDVRALIAIAQKYNYDIKLLETVDEINRQARIDFVKKAKRLLDNRVARRTVGVLGLSFKPNTDDIREAPSIDIIKALQKEGAAVKVFDPVAMPNAKKILKNVVYCVSPYEVSKDADILLIITEWNEFKELNLQEIKKNMRSPIILDGRNIYDPQEVRTIGFVYEGIGR